MEAAGQVATLRPLLGEERDISPSGGGHVSLHVAPVNGGRVLHRCADYLSPDPWDHSLLFLRSLG